MQGRGFTPENPIRCSGKSGINLYINSLKCPSGYSYSSTLKASHHLPCMTDEYLLRCRCGKNHTVTLHFDAQHGRSINSSELKTTDLKQAPLHSSKGINYTELRTLLASQKWREADFETYKLMSHIAEWEMGDGLHVLSQPKSMKNFPCTDLKTIDYLWSQASNGRFGFSVQKRIFQQLGGVLLEDIKDEVEVTRRFGELVGWYRRYTNDAGIGRPGMWHPMIDFFTWDISAPLGHLPILADDFGPKVIGMGISFGSFYRHVENCRCG